MARWSKKKMVLNGIALVAVVALVYQWWTGSPPTAPVTDVEVGRGSYDALTSAQRRLVDDWVARYSTATGASAVPRNVYDGLALSTRTTFNAVTHALSRTTLTGSGGTGGSSNITALDLVAKVDAVAGSIPGQSGDKQFRMYVQLRPDAQRTLEESREFSRQVDNTVYHRGYPVCFRGSGGTPSIQFSLALDGTHGDIDVDYRQSAFPIMLINGHLTASNSDVRAGNNDERHNGRWDGLLNWWRSVMGLPVLESPPGSAATPASEPRLKKGAKPEDAIADFLSAWLVEQNPGVAVGYLSPRAFACLELERGTPVDRGVARFQMARGMESANQRIGRVGSLTEAIRGVSLAGSAGREMAQPHHDAFVMYDVREDVAETFNCESKLHPEQADQNRAQSTRSGPYVGAVFQVKTSRLSGAPVATIWAKENDAWTLVAYDVEPEFTPGALPSAPPPAAPADAAVPAIAGDPAMLRAVRGFLEAWYLRKDTAAAFRALSPKSFACYNVYRSEDAPAATSPADAGRLIQERLALLTDWVGTGSRLEDLLSPAEPHHPDLKPVTHDGAAAYAIAAVPDSLGTALDCAQLKGREIPRPAGRVQTYGRFYAVSFRFRRAGPEAAVLWTVWAKEGQDWKVVSYLVVTP